MIEPSQRRTVLAIGAAQTLGWGSTYYLPAVLAKPVAEEIGLATSTVFGAFSMALVVAAVVGPFVGRQIDVHGGRAGLIASSLVFAAALGMLALAQSAFSLFAAWMLIGLGMALGLYEAAFATLAQLYRSGARQAITGVTLIAGFASTVCWPISAVLEAEIGWRNVCLFWAALHLVAGVPLNWSLAGRTPSREAGSIELADSTAGETNDAPSGAMLLLAVLFAATWFVVTAMAAHLPRLLMEFGATPATAIAVAALVGPAQVAGRLLEYTVLSNHHPLLSARLAALLHPLGAAILLTFGAPAALAFGALHGLGIGILTIANGTLPLLIFGAKGYGLRQGLLMAPARCAQAAAPFAFALLMESFGVMSLLTTMLLSLVGLAALQTLAGAARR